MKQIIPKRTKEKKTECLTIESYYNRKKTKVDEQRYLACLNVNNKNKRDPD